MNNENEFTHDGVTYEAAPSGFPFVCHGCAFNQSSGCHAPSGTPGCEPWNRKDARNVIWVKQ